ncbi:MAG: 5'-methylthioadenosine/adenosylhomocysteine nucleosidase [Thomasclavelia sp.]|nr:5'-methylthioadenosine/adenosylhomocysteine nucleosidase [Thomasclavelia sp.]
MIGIIGAMDEEVNAIKEYMKVLNENKVNDIIFYEGSIENKDVVLLLGGIGKVNAAVCSALLFENYDIDYLINVGSSGGLDKFQNVGDIVISDKVVHHDVDLVGFNYPYGQLPQMPLFFESNKTLVKCVKDIIDEDNFNARIGLIASGDQFVCTKGQVDTILEHFPNALCAEMEAASIAQVAYKYKKPFIILRSLSDVFGKGDNNIQFDEYLKKASKESANITRKLIMKVDKLC